MHGNVFEWCLDTWNPTYDRPRMTRPSSTILAASCAGLLALRTAPCQLCEPRQQPPHGSNQ